MKTPKAPAGFRRHLKNHLPLLRDDGRAFWIAELIGSIGTPALPVLEKAAGSDAPGLREAAVGGICAMGDEVGAGLPLLLELAGDPHLDVRFTAIERLGILAKPAGLDPGRVVPVLVRALTAPDPDVRVCAVEALA